MNLSITSEPPAGSPRLLYHPSPRPIPPRFPSVARHSPVHAAQLPSATTLDQEGRGQVLFPLPSSPSILWWWVGNIAIHSIVEALPGTEGESWLWEPGPLVAALQRHCPQCNAATRSAATPLPAVQCLLTVVLQRE